MQPLTGQLGVSVLAFVVALRGLFVVDAFIVLTLGRTRPLAQGLQSTCHAAVRAAGAVHDALRLAQVGMRRLDEGRDVTRAAERGTPVEAREFGRTVEIDRVAKCHDPRAPLVRSEPRRIRTEPLDGVRAAQSVLSAGSEERTDECH